MLALCDHSRQCLELLSVLVTGDLLGEAKSSHTKGSPLGSAAQNASWLFNVVLERPFKCGHRCLKDNFSELHIFFIF